MYGTSFQFDLKPFPYDVCRCITCDTIHMYVQRYACTVHSLLQDLQSYLFFTHILGMTMQETTKNPIHGSWWLRLLKLNRFIFQDACGMHSGSVVSWMNFAKHQLRPWPTESEGKKTVCKTASSEVFFRCIHFSRYTWEVCDDGMLCENCEWLCRLCVAFHPPQLCLAVCTCGRNSFKKQMFNPQHVRTPGGGNGRDESGRTVILISVSPRMRQLAFCWDYCMAKQSNTPRFMRNAEMLRFGRKSMDVGPRFFAFGCLNDPRPCKQNEATQGGWHGQVRGP